MSAIQKASLTVIGTALAFAALAATANAQQVQPAPDAQPTPAAQYQATPNVTVVAQASSFSYNLAAGAVSGPIGVPANIPVHLVGVQTAVGFRGVGEAALLHVPSSFIEWVGLDSTSGAAITQGFSGTAGTKIVFIDFSHQVQVEVASPDTIRVHNLSSGTRTGSITLIW
jgi:hypothetical protein